MTANDQLLIAAVFASFFWKIASVYGQKFWRIYDVFMGKKYGYYVHMGLFGIGWAEVIYASFIASWSTWKFSSLPPAGVLFFGACLAAYILTIKKMTFKSYMYKNIFGPHAKAPVASSVLVQRKHIIAYETGLFISLGILFGRYAYFCAGLVVAFGLLVLYALEKKQR